ncbi:YcaO-like family protein [Streptomyces sp. INA 01156]
MVCDVTSPTTSATVGCFSSRSGDYLRETFWGGHADTYHASTRIGVLEGLERHAGMRARGRSLTLTAALDDLGWPPSTRARPACTRTTSTGRTPGAALHPDRPVPGCGAGRCGTRAPPVPEILAYYHKPGIEHRFVQESSNGCASGGSLEEAVLSGLMEVLERDAFLLAWHGMQPLPEIDPATSADPRTRIMVDRMAMYGYRARFFDTRITFPVPVVTAVAERFDGGPAGCASGPEPPSTRGRARRGPVRDRHRLGAAPPAVPARRGRVPRHGRGPREDHQPARPSAGLRGTGDGPLHRLPAPPSLAPEPSGVADLRWARADGSGPDVREDLLAAVDAVTSAGFDVVVVDQTAPEQRALGLHTVKVLVPGLLPLDFGWTRQRARHMPRMRTALREAGLRPTT